MTLSDSVGVFTKSKVLYDAISGDSCGIGEHHIVVPGST